MPSVFQRMVAQVREGQAARRREKDAELPGRTLKPILSDTQPDGKARIPESNPQTQSLILSRLPLELRLPIYEDVFGYRKVHVAFMSYPIGNAENKANYWNHCICSVPSKYEHYFWEDWCRKREGDKTQLKLMNEDGTFDERAPKARLDVGMLYTCRQVYNEGTKVLYSTTTFDFESAFTLRLFRSQIQPQRFSTITSLELRWSCGYTGQPQIGIQAKQQYDDLWRFLAEMEGLKKLRVAIISLRYERHALQQHDVDLDEVWLGPLEQFRGRGLEVFDVAIPKSYCERFGAAREGAPWKLIEIFDGACAPTW